MWRAGSRGSRWAESARRAGVPGQPQGDLCGPEAQGKAGGGDHRPPGGARSSPGTHVGGPPGPGWGPA